MNSFPVEGSLSPDEGCAAPQPQPPLPTRRQAWIMVLKDFQSGKGRYICNSIDRVVPWELRETLRKDLFRVFAPNTHAGDVLWPRDQSFERMDAIRLMIELERIQEARAESFQTTREELAEWNEL